MGALCCRPTPIDFDGEVNLFHFVLLRCVGKGAFGKVRVVQHKQTRELYALKYINKAKCVKMKAVANIIQERRLLEEIDHPFVVNLRYAFQDDENCFFVLDLMLGGDLRFHLERLGHLSEDTVRFYVAELASALAFLHEKRIIHRDIKPDNILLDEAGHAHLTDFNIAVHYSERRMLTGVAGSMAYMAPEILAKRGYTYTIDWWSLGVCAYELIFGRRPFRGRTNSELTMSIGKDSLRFPEDAEQKCSRAGIQALQRLLERDTTKRLGCKPHGEGFRDIRQHPWFRTIDWETLETKTQTSPFIPDSRKANFDASHELEELLLEDNPLKAKRRKEQDISNLSTEMRQMEEQFTNYDFKKMHRRSYYPQNQIVSTMTATSSSGPNSSRPVTPGNDPYAEAQAHVAGIDTEGAPHEYGETERYGGIPMSKMMSEKDYRNQ
ncbi:AGC/YANK protein kinase [Punctularia strigosozonata HHB-11173 SS5]|uniref:AGC/YANK protein kinase n=1 Tax=Punctularia strigosozonata (strain HHB-11173) TaxID=741275 RepID=UPI00044168F5|nr:AGC/YANK protein kinase [Punctularia strigosozonata HHB-11173 SS5]EIN06020.1 AGC/YANK protein kinase [Punctularia strigosozonata HHB-11173 SS5]